MSLFRVSEALKRLALCLSLLAVCSALMAPVSAMAQEARSGVWSGLCSAVGTALPEGHAQADEGHCGLCLLPGLAGSAADRSQTLQPGAAAAPAGPRSAAPAAQQAAPPAIRGPPLGL